MIEEIRDSKGRFKSVSTEHSITNVKMNHYRYKANKRGIDWNLTRDQFYNLIVSNCFYCGQPPKTLAKSNKHSMFINGVDRIDNKKGYTIDNVKSCCKQCNFAKSDLTMKDFEEWINILIKYRTKNEY